MIIDVWVRVIVFVCSNVGASLCLVPCSFSALCVPSPFPHPPPLCEVWGDRMPMVWNSACAFAALQSAGFLWVGASPSLPPTPSPLSSSHFMIFQATYPFAFHLLIYQRLMSSWIYISQMSFSVVFNSVYNSGKTQTGNPLKLLFTFSFSGKIFGLC